MGQRFIRATSQFKELREHRADTFRQRVQATHGLLGLTGQRLDLEIVCEQLCIALDAAQWRPQLMSHMSEELLTDDPELPIVQIMEDDDPRSTSRSGCRQRAHRHLVRMTASIVPKHNQVADSFLKSRGS